MASKSHSWSSSLGFIIAAILAVFYAKDIEAATIRQTVGLPTVAAGLNQTMTSNSTMKPTTPEVCEDENKSCAFWSRFGYCYNGYVKGYMRKACKKSCRFCGHMSGKCRDKFFYCPSWTSYTGLFACSLSYYKIRCPYSCKVCRKH